MKAFKISLLTLGIASLASATMAEEIWVPCPKDSDFTWVQTHDYIHNNERVVYWTGDYYSRNPELDWQGMGEEYVGQAGHYEVERPILMASNAFVGPHRQPASDQWLNCQYTSNSPYVRVQFGTYLNLTALGYHNCTLYRRKQGFGAHCESDAKSSKS